METSDSFIPHSVVAHGWIPFTIITVLSFLFSVFYVIWYRSSQPQDRAPGASVIAVFGLFISLVTSILVPVDVFLISYMKNEDGSWKDWAQSEETREALKNSILYGYYTCYSIILFMAFLIIPANFFYHGLSANDEVDEPRIGTKLCHSIKFTLLSLVCFALLVVAGIFIPFNGNPPSNSTEWQKFEWFLDELDSNKGHDLIVFLLNILNIVGMGLLIFYTGYGLSSLPCGLIRSKHGVRTMLTGVERQIKDIDDKIKEIETRYENSNIPRFEQSQLERLEQQARLLKREHRDLDQRAKTVVNRCKVIFRPFQMISGVILSVAGFVIFISLLLSNVDRALNSDGPTTGYNLQNTTLPNPMDLLMVLAQQIFPMDYILYTALVFFLLSTSMSGITNIGIRCFCLSLYKIRAWRTPPRGLLLAVLCLMLIILAQNLVLFSLLPDYTTFGSQHYNHTGEILRCGDRNLPDETNSCIPSRISVLLLAFHYKAWIFGASYYWLIWILIGSVVVGSIFSLYKFRKPAIDEEAEDLIDSDDEDTSNNPFD